MGRPKSKINNDSIEDLIKYQFSERMLRTEDVQSKERVEDQRGHKKDEKQEGRPFESIARDIDLAAAQFPVQFGRALREGLPVSQAVSILSAQADAMHRPIAEALRSLLTRLHEVKSLGSYEENARAAAEVYRLAEACNVDLVYEGRAVSLECLDKKNCKAGLFRLRTLGAYREELYARVDFPPLGITEIKD